MVLLPLENLNGLGVAARKISRAPPCCRTQRLAPLPERGVFGQILNTRAKRVGVFNDKKNAPKPDRESDSSIVARGKTPVWKRVKGRTG